MEPLHYTSKEMFSSTELIRKNKMIFEKLTKREIDKAVILRDGKPSFMLMEFDQYEKLMNEFLSLKERAKNKGEKTNLEKKVSKNIADIKIEEIEIEERVYEEVEDEIDDEELATALKEIEELDLENLENQKRENKKDEKEPLKEFWE